MEAAQLGIIAPILVGPRARIEAVAKQHGIDISGFQIVDTPHSQASAEAAVRLASEGKVEMLMKGSLHTDELMAAVVRREAGLRTARRISHCFVMDVPALDRADHHHRRGDQYLPDAGRQGGHHPERHRPGPWPWGSNAEGGDPVGHGDRQPQGARPPWKPAPLCKMAERGQITGGILDGPLALDNAINLSAAKIKKIESPVAGQADILVVPDLEAGNMLAKSLSFMAEADAAGIVLGARVPIILTSRADSVTTRLASCGVAALVANARREAATRAVA